MREANNTRLKQRKKGKDSAENDASTLFLQVNNDQTMRQTHLGFCDLVQWQWKE